MTSPGVLALLDESPHRLTEIVTHVAGEDQILSLLTVQRARAWMRRIDSLVSVGNGRGSSGGRQSHPPVGCSAGTISVTTPRLRASSAVSSLASMINSGLGGTDIVDEAAVSRERQAVTDRAGDGNSKRRFGSA